MRGRLPKTGETWRHYKGTECLVLGVLSNGNRRQPRDRIVALEVSDRTQTFNPNTGVLESTKAVKVRFYRMLEDFLEVVDGQPRFELVDDDSDLWAQIVDLELEAVPLEV